MKFNSFSYFCEEFNLFRKNVLDEFINLSGDMFVEELYELCQKEVSERVDELKLRCSKIIEVNKTKLSDQWLTLIEECQLLMVKSQIGEFECLKIILRWKILVRQIEILDLEQQYDFKKFGFNNIEY